MKRTSLLLWDSRPYLLHACWVIDTTSDVRLAYATDFTPIDRRFLKVSAILLLLAEVFFGVGLGMLGAWTEPAGPLRMLSIPPMILFLQWCILSCDYWKLQRRGADGTTIFLREGSSGKVSLFDGSIQFSGDADLSLEYVLDFPATGGWWDELRFSELNLIHDGDSGRRYGLVGGVETACREAALELAHSTGLRLQFRESEDSRKFDQSSCG